MLFKIWLTNSEYDFSIITDVDSLESAILRAKEYSEKYNAKIKAIDNCYFSKTKENKEFRANNKYRNPKI
jgi:hypothetical protein